MKKITLLILIIMLINTKEVIAITVPQIEGYDVFSATVDKIAAGEFTLNPIEIMTNIVSSLTSEIKLFSGTAAAILAMVLLSASVGTLNNAFGQKGSADAAFFVFFTVISGLSLTCFRQALDYGAGVVTYMTSFMSKLTPVIIVTLFACSKSASAIAFEPVLSGAVLVISTIIENCIMPLTAFSAVLSVAGNLGSKNSISGFIKIVRSVTKWILALVITVFTGINAIYGFTASSLDAVGAKTIKFAVGTLVPVVGSFLSDTLDTVAASAGVVKNAVGVSGIIVICIICLTPIIKIGIMQIMLKLISALTEPVADARISKMLWDMSEAITAVFGVVVLTAVLFLINICIILRATG